MLYFNDSLIITRNYTKEKGRLNKTCKNFRKMGKIKKNNMANRYKTYKTRNRGGIYYE